MSSQKTLMNRRDLLKFSLVGATALGLSSIAKKGKAALSPSISMEECVSMTPQDMAKSSGEVMSSWEYLNTTANEIREPKMRAIVLGMLSNPAPTFLKSIDKKAAYNELKALDFTKASYENFLPYAQNANTSNQPFYSATGSGWKSHHAYPGGLATHVSFNVKMAKSMVENYNETYNFNADQDIVIAAQTLHDLHKPWVFQWQKDNKCRNEQALAGTGEHHVLSLAESIYRGLSADLVIAQAGAHTPPNNPQSEANIVNWLKAAAILNGKDPIKLGLIAKDGKTLPLPRRTESFITHVADHDYILSGPAFNWSEAIVKKIAQNTYNIKGNDLDGKVYNNLRNYVFAQVTAMTLYQEYVENGEIGVKNTMLKLVSKA